ncbi:hypothetical protein L2E82_16769 [Cichorium intybus]|uniref:Uncharacterized protein n=1 Tax=Cichorium intybus TaxID=13427 RepID=A0ACB9F6G8_CICIN|nr:hypothetical protein L2E82_16769 [Cichorium intybus]
MERQSLMGRRTCYRLTETMVAAITSHKPKGSRQQHALPEEITGSRPPEAAGMAAVSVWWPTVGGRRVPLWIPDLRHDLH